MITQTKLKIGTVGVALVALYTCGLALYGGEYLSGTEYITQTGAVAILAALVILFAKLLLPRMKTVAVFLIGIALISGIVIISTVMGKTVRYNAHMLIISLWPLLSYMLAKYIHVGETVGFKPFTIDFLVYDIVTVVLIWLLEEAIFKDTYMSADTIAEAYMYVVAMVAFLQYGLKVREDKPDKWDIFCMVVVICITIAFWICNQERAASIVDSLHYDSKAVDAEGEHINWISHRLKMLQISFQGDFQAVHVHRIKPMIKGCSLAWLSSVGGLYITVAIFILHALLSVLMIVYARKKGTAAIWLLTVSFILKSVIGVVTNMFLIFSTSVGCLLIITAYDIIPLGLYLFDAVECGEE